jgi:hypothetical protein
MGDGSIEADVEGTVIALVDFPTALIALPELHTDRNEQLWLAPRTDRIPTIGTRCSLAFRLGPLAIALDATGRVQLMGRPVTLSELARAVQRARKQNPGQRIRLSVDASATPSAELRLLGLLRSLGVPEGDLAADRLDPSPPRPAGHDPDALAGSMQGRLHRPEPDRPRPAARSGSPRRLADDLRQRIVALRIRAEDVFTQAAHLARDLRFGEPATGVHPRAPGRSHQAR